MVREKRREGWKWQHGSKEQIKTNLSPTRGEIISGGSWGRAEWINERGEGQTEDNSEMKKSEHRTQRGDAKEGNAEWKEWEERNRLTSAGLKVSTPSFKPCFKLLLFCLIDWTWETKCRGRKRRDGMVKLIFGLVAPKLCYLNMQVVAV